MEHVFGNVLAELGNLFADVAEEGVRRPASNDHDGVGVLVVPDEPHTPDEPGAPRDASGINSLSVNKSRRYIRFFGLNINLSCSSR